MDRFLIKYDFNTVIDSANIDELTKDNDFILFQSIDEAISEASGYTDHRYDNDEVYKPVKIVQSNTVSGVTEGDRFFQQITERFYYAIQDNGTDLTNTDDFTQSDNRHQKLKSVVVDIALYNLHSRLSPRNIPELRRIRYDGDGKLKESMSAIGWLIKVQRAEVDPGLPVLTDSDGDVPENSQRFAFGTSSNLKYKY